MLPASGAVSPEVKRILTVKKLAMPDTVVVACVDKGSVSEQLVGSVRGDMAKLGFPQDLPVVSSQGFYADLMATCDSYIPMPEEHLDRPFTAHVAGVDGAGVLAYVSQGFIQVGNRCDFFNKDSLDRGSISDIEVFGMATKQASAGEWVRIATDNEKADLSETTLIGRVGFARRGDKFAVDVTFIDGAVADLSAADLQVYIDGFAYPATFSRIKGNSARVKLRGKAYVQHRNDTTLGTPLLIMRGKTVVGTGVSPK
jgi:translation elongation factor EF-Tu-like GTPase